MAGAWTRDVGDGYARVGVDVFVALQQPSSSPGARVEGAHTESASVYAELGILPSGWGHIQINAPASLSTQTTSVSDPFGASTLRASTTRVGDVRGALQVALHPSWPLAASMEWKVPGYRNGKVGEAFPLVAFAFPKPGDGQVDITSFVDGGFSLRGDGFGELGVGYLHRTAWFVGWQEGPDFSDGLRVRAKLGLRVGRCTPILGSEGLLSWSPTPVTRSFVSVWGTVLVALTDRVALEPRAAADLWVANAARGVSGGIGVSYLSKVKLR